MKRHNKARKAIELSAVIILASAILGACAENVQKQKIPAATYMGGKASITGICKELDAAGASHVDLFQEWVVDFALCSESTEGNYTGTYLMFDTEAIDNVDRYEIIKKNRDMFTTLYGEKRVTEGSSPETVFSDSWKYHGFQINSDRISLLSIVIYDPYSEVVFVGHTGILIKYSDYYLFVEKIAFEQPYQATKVHTVDELLNIMSLRAEYFGEEGEAGPFVYNNGEYIGTLKKNIDMAEKIPYNRSK